MADDTPIPMSEFHLGERYTSEDMYRDYPDLKLGDRFAVERDGVVYTEMVESVRWDGGAPAIYRDLNWWQRIARRLTPRRWRKSLLVDPGWPPSVTINGDQPDPAGKTLAQLKQMKTAIDRLTDDLH